MDPAPLRGTAGRGAMVKRPLALFVLGAQRSGTSATARTLALCGGTLPGALLGADQSNPAGYWEPREAIDLNEAILYRLGSGWADPTLRLQDQPAFDPDQSATYTAQIGNFLAGLPAAPLLIIKEPRITIVSGLWFKAARSVGLDVAVVVALRHPQEVVASLVKHGRVSPHLASALWLKYNLLAERNTRGVPRVFVDYANLLSDWRWEIARVSTALAIDFDIPDQRVIDEFLTHSLRRQQHCGPVTDLFGTDWMSSVYEELGSAARDEPVAETALDQVFEAYRASAQDFRALFQDFDGRFGRALIRTVSRPAISRRTRALLTWKTRVGESYRLGYRSAQRAFRVELGTSKNAV
nr:MULTISPECIES: sulfotransferase family protein [unclassified Mycobacterium]